MKRAVIVPSRQRDREVRHLYNCGLSRGLGI